MSVSVTPDAEKTIGYIARVSNPANQDNPKVAGLSSIVSSMDIGLCLSNNDFGDSDYQGTGVSNSEAPWKPFPKSSQRYADSSALGDIRLPELRRQDTKNRQNSIDDIDPFLKQKYEILMQQHFEQGMRLYQQMLEDDIAKECARFVLPLAVGNKTST